MIGLLVMSLWACTPSEPDPAVAALRPVREAVDAYEAGRAAMEAGRAEEALAHMKRAREARPDDALLVAWYAQALAGADRLEEAVHTLDGLVARHPAFGIARLHRGAYHARLGHLQEAAGDLRAALDAGVITPREALIDDDFAPHVGHPAFVFLPRAPLSASWTVSGDPVFLGSETEVVLTVAGAGDGPVRVDAGLVQGPVELMRALDDARTRPDGDPERVVTWVLRATGAGDVRVSADGVRHGERSSQVGEASFQTLAPGDRSAAATTLVLRSPSEVRGDRMPPAAWRDGEVVWVLTGPGSRVRVDPEAEPVSPAWSLRTQGDPVAILWRYGPDVVRVRVTERAVPIADIELPPR